MLSDLEIEEIQSQQKSYRDLGYDKTLSKSIETPNFQATDEPDQLIPSLSGSKLPPNSLSSEQIKLKLKNIESVQIGATVDNLPDNTIVDVFVQHTFTNAAQIQPLTLQADLYAIQKADGYIINSVNHDFNLTGTQDDAEFWMGIGNFRNKRIRNSVDTFFQVTNSSGNTQDYWVDYDIFYLREEK